MVERGKTQGEEAYLAAHVLPKDDKRGFPYLTALRIITSRYPARLPAIFLTVLEKRRDIQIWSVAKAVNESSLPREKKLELFLRAADDQDLEHRRAAYWELKTLDERAFVDRLVKTIDALPRTPVEPYWHCREASFANLVTETSDPRAWQALTAAARRADVWLRMQYLQPMDYSDADDHDHQRQMRVQFLAQFLDDAEVRQAPEKKGKPDMNDVHSGPYAGFTFAHLEVRDLAAMKIASILKLPEADDQKHDWTPEQWSGFRARVKSAVTQGQQ